MKSCPFGEARELLAGASAAHLLPTTHERVEFKHDDLFVLRTSLEFNDLLARAERFAALERLIQQTMATDPGEGEALAEHILTALKNSPARWFWSLNANLKLIWLEEIAEAHGAIATDLHHVEPPSPKFARLLTLGGHLPGYFDECISRALRPHHGLPLRTLISIRGMAHTVNFGGWNYPHHVKWVGLHERHRSMLWLNEQRAHDGSNLDEFRAAHNDSMHAYYDRDRMLELDAACDLILFHIHPIDTPRPYLAIRGVIHLFELDRETWTLLARDLEDELARLRDRHGALQVWFGLDEPFSSNSLRFIDRLHLPPCTAIEMVPTQSPFSRANTLHKQSENSRD